MATCKGCGAEILWALTAASGGKTRIPLDASPVKRMVVVGDDHGVPIVSMGDTYMPHHATCPKADDFKLRRHGDM